MASAGAAAAPSADAAPDPAARHAELEATRERRTKLYDLIAHKEQELEAIIRRNPGRRGPIPALTEHERGSSRARTPVAQTTFGCANALLLLLQRQRGRWSRRLERRRPRRQHDHDGRGGDATATTVTAAAAPAATAIAVTATAAQPPTTVATGASATFPPHAPTMTAHAAYWISEAASLTARLGVAHPVHAHRTAGVVVILPQDRRLLARPMELSHMTRREAGRSPRGAARGGRRAAGAGAKGGVGGSSRSGRQLNSASWDWPWGAQLQGEQIISQSQHFPFLNTAKGSTFPHHSFNIKRMPICGFITRKIPHAQHSPQVEQLPRGVLVGRGGSAASSFHFHPFSFFVLFFFFNPLVP